MTLFFYILKAKSLNSFPDPLVLSVLRSDKRSKMYRRMIKKKPFSEKNFKVSASFDTLLKTKTLRTSGIE